MIGVLVWQKGDMLHLSLDRLTFGICGQQPSREIHLPMGISDKLNGDWDTVWKVADEPYDRDPGPPNCGRLNRV
jgi:hypothetical protein